MDIAQLKLHATRTRALLEQANYPVGHNQSLDLIAALPGLRNWPEVQAFPDRVAACDLDLASTGRLAFRLKKKFGIDATPQSLLAQLTPPGEQKSVPALHIWPTGPRAGVYITTSQGAVDALLDRYEEATDGAVLYAEQAGNHKDGSIDLGDGGLWSSGLARVPSGTLLVVGPLRLDQQSWDESARRLEMACLNALTSGHRVAVLFDTPTPDTLAQDALLMVRRVQPDGDDTDTALTGVVTDDGDMQPRVPFALPHARPFFVPTVANPDAIPYQARASLQQALAGRNSGLLLFGSAVIGEHWAVDLVNSSLALTEHAGPAARIMPRHRGTPAKDWQVPEALRRLPFLPSVESAYDQGYRRIVINPNYTDSEILLEYGKDVLFISGGHAADVTDTFMTAVRGHSLREEADLLELVIALLAVTEIPVGQAKVAVPDLFIKDETTSAFSGKKFGDLMSYLREHRVLRFENQLSALLETGAISVDDLKGMSRNRSINEFLDDLGEGTK